MSQCDCGADERTWGKLRGTMLSDYVGGPLETYGSSTFAWHLKNHGTQQDFSTWIEKHPKPFMTACEMFLHAEDFAKNWLIECLDGTFDSDVHHKILTNLAHSSKFTHGVSPQACDVLNHIKYDRIKSEDLASTLQVLLQAKAVDLLEKNWSVFEPVAIPLAPKLLIYAASFGWDMKDKLNVEPSNPTQYFVLCCTGGLLHRVKEYAVDASEVDAIHQAFVQTTLCQHDPRKMNDVLHHLWDTYPNQPWHLKEENAAAFLHADPALVQKMAEHHHMHAPEAFKKHAEGFACHAIYEKKHKLLDVLFPYIDPTDYHKVFGNALTNKRKSALKALLHKCTKNNTGHEGFYKALEKHSLKTQQWANEIYAEHQKEMLHSKLQTIRDGKSRSPGKKM